MPVSAVSLLPVPFVIRNLQVVPTVKFLLGEGAKVVMDLS